MNPKLERLTLVGFGRTSPNQLATGATDVALFGHHGWYLMQNHYAAFRLEACCTSFRPGPWADFRLRCHACHRQLNSEGLLARKEKELASRSRIVTWLTRQGFNMFDSELHAHAVWADLQAMWQDVMTGEREPYGEGKRYWGLQ